MTIKFNKTFVQTSFDSGDYRGNVKISHPCLDIFIHPKCNDKFWDELEVLLAVTVDSFIKKHESINKRVLLSKDNE